MGLTGLTRATEWLVKIKCRLTGAVYRLLGDKLGEYISVADFGVVTGRDCTAEFQAAIDALPAGATLGVHGGPFIIGSVTFTKPIKLVGNASITMSNMRIKTSKFKSELTGTLTAKEYVNTTRGFTCYAYQDGVDYEDIKILGARFEGFFYSTDFRGRAYEADENDPTNRVLKDTMVFGCTSVGPLGQNAGHFQHCGVTNAKCIGNSTYRGINATSYNFINGNGSIIVMGNYDHDNTYGSLEIENNKVSYGVVSGNVFHEQLWIDDTSNINVSGNTVSDRILITAQSYDVSGVNLSGNTCGRISLSQFGNNPVGRIKGIAIRGNQILGLSATNGITADDSVDVCTIENNDFIDVPITHSCVSFVRNANTELTVRNNKGNGRPLALSGSGGTVINYGNLQMPESSTGAARSNTPHLNALMQPYSDYLDLPGKYLHGTKYTGNLAPSAASTLSLAVPDSGSLAFRGVSLWVLVRDTGSNNTSSFRVDCLYKVVGTVINISFGTPYSALGVDTGSIALANAASTTSSINIVVTNTHATKVFQVTIMPEVTSRLGTEE